MQPWDRQPFDSDESFMWFVAYRDMIPPRRLSKVARSVPGKVCPPLQALLNLYNEGHWSDRAAAWDQHLDTIRQEEHEAAVKSAAQQEQEVLADLHELVAREVDKTLRTSIANDAELDAGNVMKTAATVERLIKTSRLVRGETTEKVGQSIDLSGMPIEEIRAFRARVEQARKSQG